MMWFIELHLLDSDKPIFINFDKVAEIHASDKGGALVSFASNRGGLHVKEDYDTIMQFMIKRMSANAP